MMDALKYAGHPGHGNGQSLDGQPLNIRRFFGVTHREAMREVRLALGSEALIVSNRRVNGGVEILAANADIAAGEALRASAPRAAAVSAHPPGLHAAGQSSFTQPASAQHPAMLMDAITTLRAEFAHRMEDLVWNQQVKQAPQALSLFQTLLGMGFSTALLRPLLQGLPAQSSEQAALAWVRQELVKRLPHPGQGDADDALWRPGLVLALVGPTGVGKTTTLAKLAARAVRRFGAQHVALVTTDTYRIGACEQLKIYGQILRTPVHVAHDAAELQAIVRSLPVDHVLLIDNVGVSQRDSAVKAQAAMLCAAGRTVERLLVLNAASHGDTLDEVAHTYRHDGGAPLAGCILSKLDEALRLAPALDTAIRHQLPIHYVSKGQKVPEHLARITAQDLIDQALAPAISGKTLYAPNRADLAALMTLADADRAQSQAQDQTRLLADVVTLLQPAGASLPPDMARQALDELDAHAVCAQAFALWQAQRRAGELAHAGGSGDLAASLWQTVSDACASAPASCLLALHDHATLASAGQGSVRWVQMGSLSQGDGLRPLALPLQVRQSPNAWRACGGGNVAGAPNETEARLRQVRDVETQRVNLSQSQPQLPPLLHVFDGGSSGFWRQLQELGVAWAASCAPGSVVIHEDTPTRIGTLARRAAYQWLDVSGWQHGLHADRSPASVAVWFAVDAVALRARRQSSAQAGLRLIHLRVQDRRDGSLIHQWSVLSHAALDDAALARALLARHAQKSLARLVQAAWRALSSDAGAPPEQAGGYGVGASTTQSAHAPTALAVYLALAAWCVQQRGATSAARAALVALCARAKPTASATVAGLLRLFTMKDLLQPPEARTCSEHP